MMDRKSGGGAGTGHEWQVYVGPEEQVPLRKVIQSVSTPEDSLYRKVLAAMVDPQQTPEADVRRYFWGVVRRHQHAELTRELIAAALAGGETDPLILNDLHQWQTTLEATGTAEGARSPAPIPRPGLTGLNR